MNDTPHAPSAKSTAPAADQGPRELDVRALLGDAREAVLIHLGERYRLRITASGKLILTK